MYIYIYIYMYTYLWWEPRDGGLNDLKIRNP